MCFKNLKRNTSSNLHWDKNQSILSKDFSLTRSRDYFMNDLAMKSKNSFYNGSKIEKSLSYADLRNVVIFIDLIN